MLLCLLLHEQKGRAKRAIPRGGSRSETVDFGGIPREPVAQDAKLQVKVSPQVGHEGLELGVPGSCLQLQVKDLTGQGFANFDVQDRDLSGEDSNLSSGSKNRCLQCRYRSSQGGKPWAL